MKNTLYHLDDWLTTQDFPFFSKITERDDDVLHDHTFFEIFYLLDGSICHELNGEIQSLRVGDMLFLHPSDKHIFLREEKQHCSHRDIIMRKEFFKSMCDFISDDLYDRFVSEKTQKLFNIDNGKIRELEETFTAISDMSALKNNKSIALSIAKATCTGLIGMLLNTKIENGEPDWFNSLLRRLSDPAVMFQGWDIILSPFFFSREHICRVFKAKTGKTLTEYLNDQRLILAANRLAYSDDTVLSVCMNHGFSSVAYFNSLFKKKYGVSPRDFRKQLRNRKAD